MFHIKTSKTPPTPPQKQHQHQNINYVFVHSLLTYNVVTACGSNTHVKLHCSVFRWMAAGVYRCCMQRDRSSDPMTLIILKVDLWMDRLQTYLNIFDLVNESCVEESSLTNKCNMVGPYLLAFISLSPLNEALERYILISYTKKVYFQSA